MSYCIEFPESGLSFSNQLGESILESAKRENVELPFGCSAGGCSVCKVKVLEGEVEYPDGLPMGLLEEEAAEGLALVCVAHPTSDLVLEPANDATDWEPW